MNVDKLKLKRLLSKYNYLEIYLEEVNYKYKEYNQKFLSEYYELHPEELTPIKHESIITEPITPTHQTTGDSEKDYSNLEEEPMLSDSDIVDSIKLKNLYKKLSLKTHPDKNNGDDSIFKIVLHAYKNKNILKLINIANQFNISIEYDDNMITYIEDNILNIEKKIDELQHHLCWLWCNANNDDKKKFKLPK